MRKTIMTFLDWREVWMIVEQVVELCEGSITRVKPNDMDNIVRRDTDGLCA